MKTLEPKPYVPTPLEKMAGKKDGDIWDILFKLVNSELLSGEQVGELGGKAEVVKMMYPGLTFDTALPQLWLDNWTGKEYGAVLFGTVWAYPKGYLMGLPFPVTEEANHLVRGREPVARQLHLWEGLR